MCGVSELLQTLVVLNQIAMRKYVHTFAHIHAHLDLCSIVQIVILLNAIGY